MKEITLGDYKNDRDKYQTIKKAISDAGLSDISDSTPMTQINAKLNLCAAVDRNNAERARLGDRR